MLGAGFFPRRDRGTVGGMVASTWTELLLARDSVRAGGGRLRVRDDLERVRRGAYVPRVESLGVAQDRRRLALARIRAVHEQLRLEKWFSHESAALLWDCDVVGLSGRAHIIQRTRPRSRGDDTLVRHHGAVPVDQRAEVGGLPVTTLSRTIVDCAASLPADRALVIADSALRRGADPAGVAQIVAARAGTRGIARVREVMAFADGRAQSPGETLVRWLLHQEGVPAPEPQVRVVTRRGPFFLDLGWRDRRVGLEFDGFVKYSGAYGNTAPEAVFAEKLRQDAIEDAGWRILRATWSDLRTPGALAARARHTLGRPPRYA